MATAKQGVDEGVWFIGKDFELRFRVFTDDTLTECLDVSTYTMEYALVKGIDDPSPPILSKTTGSGITVTGVFDADPGDNTQLVVVDIDADDTIDLRAGDYQHALARTDTGNATVLLYTDESTPVVLTKAAL